MELFKIFGTLGLNGVNETNSQLQGVTGTAKNASSGMGAAFKKIGTALAAAFAVDKIVDFGKAIVNAAAEVGAEQSAFEQIMGDYVDTATAKVAEIADATGMVDTRLTPYMTSMTAKFKGLGYDVEDATTFAQRGLTLAADAAAFWDKSLDDSMGHLNSFINGSYEGGEAIGLFANDTQMAMYAVEQGIVSTTKEWANLDEATKQATRLQYAENMFALSGASGQAAKEAEQFANVQANLNEKWRQFKALIGEPLLQNVVTPAMAALSTTIDIASEAFNVLTGKVDLSQSSFAKFEEPINKVKVAFETLKQIFEPVFETIKSTIEENIPKWKESFEGLKESFQALQPAFEFVAGEIVIVLGVIGGVINGLVGAINGVIEVFGGVIQTVGGYWEMLIGITTGNAEQVNHGWETIQEGAVTVFGGLWDAVSGFVEGFVNGIVSFFDGLGIDVIGIFETIKTFFTGLWESIQEIWDTICNVVQVGIMLIGEIISAAIQIITLPFQFIWENCKEYVFAAWEWIKEKVSTAINFIANVISTVWGTIKSVTSTVWNAIKTVISNVWNTIKTTVSNATNNVKTTISNKLNAAKSIVSNILESIKEKFRSIFEKAKSIVKDAIEAIKEKFNFTWSLPKLKLPHISISGSFSLNPPSVPEFGIDWYKKAMENPMWLDSPTIFGMNPSGKLLGGGEAGDEVVAGAAKLKSMIADGVREETDNMSYKIDRLLDMLAEYMPEVIKNMQRELVLDSGAIVGQLAPAMDGRLGDINELRKRGN